MGDEVQQPWERQRDVRAVSFALVALPAMPTAGMRARRHGLAQAERNSAWWDERWDPGHHTMFATSAENGACRPMFSRRKA